MSDKTEKPSLTIFGTTQIMSFSSDLNNKSQLYLGGNGILASLAASTLTSVNLVSVIGTDISRKALQQILNENVRIDDLQQLAGKSFFYDVYYNSRKNNLTEESIQFGVYSIYEPQMLSSETKHAANILFTGSKPQLSLEVFEQIETPQIIAVDTLLYHLEHNFLASVELLKKATHIFMNEQEHFFLQKKIGNDFFEFFPKLKYLFLKKGKKGIEIVTRDKNNNFKAPEMVRPSNPVNAGDVLSGTIMGCIAQGKNLEEDLPSIIQIAQKQAARVILDDPFYRKKLKLPLS